jgi:lipopolysaccharide transport system permease protein
MTTPQPTAPSPTAGAPFQWEQTRELLRQLTVREIAETVKGSALGILWLVLNPLLMMALYVIVFGVLFGGSFDRVENESPLAFAAGVYIGLSTVALINETLSRSTATITRNANLVKKVVFPLGVLPAVQVLGSGFRFGVNAILWLTFSALVGETVGIYVLLLPVILFPLFALAFGLALLISALSVYFRDIQQVTSVFTQVIFWSSGVFFSSVRVMEHPPLWAILKWNPFFLIIENTRAVTLWGLLPSLGQLIYLYALSALCLALGAFVFSRLKAGFADFL